MKRASAEQRSALQWAQRQLTLDRQRLGRKPLLWARKVERMRASPFAFLRGAAPLFYEILAHHPELARGPEGEGWIAGDLHLENFGCYRIDPLSKAASRVVFHINDLDDASVAPWRWDVLRLTTSLLLAARGLGMSGPGALDLCRSLLEGYGRGLERRAGNAPVPAPVQTLVRDAQRLTEAELLKGRTRGAGKHRRFVRGPRYQPISAALAAQGRAAFQRYVARQPMGHLYAASSFEVLDLAFRVAGTGSLGALRLGVLVRGKGGPHGAWMFDMKEEGAPAPAALLDASSGPGGADRVVAALACLPHPPQLAGATQLGGRSMLVRRLAPQEERLDLQQVQPPEWPELAFYLGSLVAQLHRGGTPLHPRAWTAKGCELVLDHACVLAGIHEATYLAFCRLTGTPRRR